MGWRAIGVIASMLASGYAYAAPQYICDAHHVVGFQRNKETKRWATAHFSQTDTLIVGTPSSYDQLLAAANWHERKHENVQFVIRRTVAPGSALAQLRGSSPIPVAACKQGFGKAGFLKCRGFANGGEFQMNRETGRFVFYSDPFSYLSKGLSMSSLLFAEIGTCSAISATSQ